MPGLLACPFCRAMFEPGEATSCPECGLRLADMAKLPPSYEAKADDPPPEPIPPHMEQLPWTFAGRGRAALALVAALGLACFFAPWVTETAPEILTWSGWDFAHRLGWLWAPAIAWFVMLPLVVSRRSIYKMRGARVAVAFLAGIVVMTVGVRLLFVPKTSVLRPVRFEWGWGMYATAGLALVALGLAFFFGGRLDDLPTRQRRDDDEVLH